MSAQDWRSTLGALLPDGYTPEPEGPADSSPAAPKPRLNVTIDRKRAGKTATIVSGFEPGDPAADTLAAELKRRLATGGSARGGEILVQGDRRKDVAQLLRDKGYKVVCQ